MEKDMTVGNPTKMILNFTIPLFIGNVFQQLYNMADTIIVGKFVGANALAAVGSTGTIMFLIIGFLQGMTAGFTVPTAQKFGAGDMRSVRKTVGSAAILSLIVSAIMTVISMVGMRWLLHFMNTPDNIFDDAYRYIMVICAGIFAQVLYNLLASILRALGNSKTPLYFLILAAVLNIILDLVFIIVFHMGAAGAAYGHLRSVMSGLYHQKGSDFKTYKRRLEIGWNIGEDPVWNWISDGVSIFHHGDRRNDDAVFSEYPGFRGDCRIYGSQQDRAAGNTGVCGAGNDDGNLLCPEYGGRKDSQDPTGI